MFVRINAAKHSGLQEKKKGKEKRQMQTKHIEEDGEQGKQESHKTMKLHSVYVGHTDSILHHGLF